MGERILPGVGDGVSKEQGDWWQVSPPRPLFCPDLLEIAGGREGGMPVDAAMWPQLTPGQRCPQDTW